ncbi:cystathionine gamma-synthase [Bifidobacterium sp. 82T24]|uniref:Cystathionine gamma-synthase n=1 Tax=Bifidobacterium saimiriisciurei TaxID=2661627 RepID=A0ABX0CDB7_9BIFI|nr:MULTISPECIES: cystathionine gamma-synthase [Bifidobacterium]MBW3088489.1 cystathionine gamma-synthase [Bifidobacterium pluvialisilvae]NEG96565.1 cystathionine gamma-synthase [Bifidobacterium sp. SMB2]NEH10518.1 cystathionine gamma-synthase [Bifidobacterium saimiriisciurei]NEH10699.1 cystathionine gamma-synthase [Bifidobacterium saimiriisciurei]
MTIDFTATQLATRAIHAGQEPDATTGAVVPPLYLTSTYKQDGVGNLRKGYDYTRSGNPTRDSFDTQLAAIEGGRYALAFSSGLAAIDVLLRSTLKPGDRILLGDDVYGGTYRLLSKVFVPWGVGLDVVDISNVDAVKEALAANDYAYIWVETPSNPMLRITDVEAVSALAHEHGTKVVVDNTFASPVLQHPLELGADHVVYSTTKYIGGHSDVVGGAIVTNDEETRDAVAFLQNSAGAVPAPFDSWLQTRGLKTLELRVKRHSANALAVAEHLAGLPEVEKVLYPGLESHPGHDIAVRQMHGGFGGVVSVQLAGGRDAALKFAESTEIFTLAESLGGVESLIEHPAAMTHASVAGTTLQVPDNLIRLSVGIENVDDLIADLDQALERAK